MIKCFIAHKLLEPPFGNFEKHGNFYIAKVSNNNPNTLAILDADNNWVPFSYIEKYILDFTNYDYYFALSEPFYVKNKKELNEYIPTTKFYK